MASARTASTRTTTTGEAVFSHIIESFLHPFDFGVSLKLGDFSGAYQTGQLFFLNGQALFPQFLQISFLLVSQWRGKSGARPDQIVFHPERV